MADPGDEAARLEAALTRIAQARPSLKRPSAGEAGLDKAALASRLDALITELRGVLGRDSAD